jgi:hypothetical protein
MTADELRAIRCDEHQNVVSLNAEGELTVIRDCFYCWALTFSLPLGYADRIATMRLARTIMGVDSEQ